MRAHFILCPNPPASDKGTVGGNLTAPTVAANAARLALRRPACWVQYARALHPKPNRVSPDNVDYWVDSIPADARREGLAAKTFQDGINSALLGVALLS
jgi:hypothetical protein